MDAYNCCHTCAEEARCENLGIGPNLKDGFGKSICTRWVPKTEAPAADNVNHPAHYESGKYECIDVMAEALGADVVKGFCLGNAFKYLYRCQKKHDSPTEDVAKAKWYINKYLELSEAGKADV